MALIHVIIPCYNVEKYLEQAVESVLEQPFQDVDIILVDDGSPGITPQLCDEIAAREERVRVIHKPNGGVSSARNAGINYILSNTHDCAHLAYAVFLDADDCWTQDFLSVETIALLDGGYDLIGFQSCTCDSNLMHINRPGMMAAGLHHGGADHVWIHALQHFGAMFYSCRLLRDFNIRFQEGLCYSEDKIFSMTCIYLADHIYLENRPMYLYRITPWSAMGRRTSGIPYFTPIIEGYLHLDKQMLPFSNEMRGRLFAAKCCVRHYIMDMIDEHFQCGRSKTDVDKLLEQCPHYLEALTATGNFSDIEPEGRFVQYRSTPWIYILRQRALGVLNTIKRAIKHHIS